MASKADLKAEEKELNTLIAAARKKGHKFAVLISKDGVVIAADRKKSFKMMRDIAKKKGGSGRSGWGELTVEGKTFMLTCEAEFPGNLQQLIRKHLAARGQSMQVDIRLQEFDAKPALAEEPDNQKNQHRPRRRSTWTSWRPVLLPYKNHQTRAFPPIPLTWKMRMRRQLMRAVSKIVGRGQEKTY